MTFLFIYFYPRGIYTNVNEIADCKKYRVYKKNLKRVSNVVLHLIDRAL
jgi:hypothetical protein